MPETSHPLRAPTPCHTTTAASAGLRLLLLLEHRAAAPDGPLRSASAGEGSIGRTRSRHGPDNNPDTMTDDMADGMTESMPDTMTDTSRERTSA